MKKWVISNIKSSFFVIINQEFPKDLRKPHFTSKFKPYIFRKPHFTSNFKPYIFLEELIVKIQIHQLHVSPHIMFFISITYLFNSMYFWRRGRHHKKRNYAYVLSLLVHDIYMVLCMPSLSGKEYIYTNVVKKCVYTSENMQKWKFKSNFWS